MHDPVAAFNLGLLYSGRDGHRRDLSKETKLLHRSANAGYVPAMYSLGMLLAKHPELSHSSQDARSLLAAAADAGSWKASVALGVLARDGNGEAADQEAAYYHFKVASLQGGEAAQRILAKDFSNLSVQLPAERQRALASNANNWFDQHHLTLVFVPKDRDNWRQFLASPLTADDEGAHGAQLTPLPSA
jgi:TPR repeat protein